MAERIHKAALSQSQGREGWSVIFRHPVLLDRTTGKPGRRVRRGLGTKDQKAGGRLVAELNELLADKEFWEPSSIPRAMARFNPLVVDIFYHDMVPDIFDAYNIRDAALAFPLSSDSDYRQVLLLGSTGGGKTTLVRQLIGSDPESERFPSTSTARTTMADMEIVLTANGPFRTVVTFLPGNEVRDYLEESMSLTALAAYDGESERAVLDRLLHHVSQRFRLSYVLGAVDFEDADNDELSEGSPAERGDYDLTETRQLLRSTVKRLRQIAQDHAPGLRKELDEAESDEIVREELFEDSFDSLLRGDDRFQILVEDLMDEVQRRFDLLPGGDLAKTKQGWPRSWAYESEDRETFLTVISRFTSNYARRFGSLLTPLVSGIRIAGPFSPKWTDRQPKLVLVDGEGLGHTPDPAASLPTAVTARFDHIDAVLLVDNATQPMQAATVAAMRNLASSGQTDKLIFCFTHFDAVTGDNIPTFRLKQQHVLASADSALISIGEQLGSFAERGLRQRLRSASFFLGDLHRTLIPATTSEKRTIEQLQQLLRAVEKIVDRPGLAESRPVYDRMNLVLAARQAAEEFHSGWQARMGLKAKSGVTRVHWRITRALARRLGEGWGDEYLGLNPLADLHKAMQESIYRFMQNPLSWTRGVPSDDEKQRIFSKFAEDVSVNLLLVVTRRMAEEAIQQWRQAFYLSGKGSTFRRAKMIAGPILEGAAPLAYAPDPESSKFLNGIIDVVRKAAERNKIVLH